MFKCYMRLILLFCRRSRFARDSRSSRSSGGATAASLPTQHNNNIMI